MLDLLTGNANAVLNMLMMYYFTPVLCEAYSGLMVQLVLMYVYVSVEPHSCT